METSQRSTGSVGGDDDCTDSGVPRPKRPRRSLLCPHCEEVVSKTTYYRHKAAYYNESENEWLRKVNDGYDSSDSDSVADKQDDVGGADDGMVLYSYVHIRACTLNK